MGISELPTIGQSSSCRSLGRIVFRCMRHAPNLIKEMDIVRVWSDGK